MINSISPQYALIEDPTITHEKKFFVCVVDGVVVGNIYNDRQLENNMEIFLPKWESLKTILKSPNHKFIEHTSCIVNGTLWDGENFIAPIEEINVAGSINICFKKVNDSYIYYDNSMWIAIKDYITYIIELLEEYLKNNPSLCVNIFVNLDAPVETNNDNKTIKIGINYVQTIMSDEVANLATEPQSKIEFNNKKYTVNMEMFDFLNPMDIIFEYSKPNIKNLEVSGLYSDYLKKVRYISPSVYKFINNSSDKSNKNVDTLTLFADEIASPRRQIILDDLNKNFQHTHRFNCFNEELKELMQNTKILINVHQSDYENTFEEIRILPALLNKVLVISEPSPLNELLPYNRLIIWANYDNIIEKTKEVLENYDTYFNDIFCQENVNLLNNLHGTNQMNLLLSMTSFTN
jgi:hypothetical protein